MKLKSIITFIFLFSAISFAQEFISDFTWNFGFPNSNTKEYISNNSYRGLSIEGRRFIDKNISAGLFFGWNIFDQRLNEPINIDGEGYGGTISGTQLRYINSFPLMANIHYYVGKRKDVRFYLGAGAGVYYILQRLDLGVWRIDNDNWHFGLAPEAGILIPLDSQSHILVNLKYNYAFDSGTAIGGDEDNSYSYWGVNFGFAFSNMF